MMESDAWEHEDAEARKLIEAFRHLPSGLVVRPASAAHLMDRSRQDRLLGRWKGDGEQLLQAGDLLTLSMNQPAHVIPQAVRYRFSLAIHFEVAGTQVVGDGEVYFDLKPLSLDRRKDVYLDIVVTFREDGGIKLDLQNIETDSHFAFCEMHLSDDGHILAGNYYAMGLATRYPVSSVMRLQKVARGKR